ncbi:MAG: glycosyltransferase family 4 protein, partial [Pseudomonadota bacterium]
HKGPDLIGPRISRAFDIPYAIVEASRAQKRADGPWARGFFLADEALQAAHALGVVTRRDRPALEAFAPEAIVPFPPFVDTTPFQRLSTGDGHHVVCAGMMRPGRKAESFRILADVFRIIRAERPDTRFTVAGDGEARGELEPLFPPGTFTGLLAQDQLAHLFSRSDIFVWPAIDEPFGFVFLEAQAAGLPVVGGAARGVFDVVQDGKTGLLAEPTDAPALARATLSLLSDQDQRRAMASAARSFAGENDLQAGAARLGALLTHAARRHGKAP